MTESVYKLPESYSFKSIWRITFPILVALVMEELLGMTDTAFLGRVGEIELGASAIAGVYFTILYMLGFGFSIGVAIGEFYYENYKYKDSSNQIVDKVDSFSFMLNSGNVSCRFYL